MNEKQPKRAEDRYPGAHGRWEQWASERLEALAESGHPDTSPTYRMMREGDATPGRHDRSPFDYRQHRTAGGLTLTPKRTALGKESRSVRRGMTSPELCADRYRNVKTMEWLFRQMPEQWWTLIVLRYEERIASHAAIAREMDMDRREVNGYLMAALSWTHNMLREIGQTRAA